MYGGLTALNKQQTSSRPIKAVGRAPIERSMLRVIPCRFERSSNLLGVSMFSAKYRSGWPLDPAHPPANFSTPASLGPQYQSRPASIHHHVLDEQDARPGMAVHYDRDDQNDICSFAEIARSPSTQKGLLPPVTALPYAIFRMYSISRASLLPSKSFVDPDSRITHRGA